MTFSPARSSIVDAILACRHSIPLAHRIASDGGEDQRQRVHDQDDGIEIQVGASRRRPVSDWTTDKLAGRPPCSGRTLLRSLTHNHVVGLSFYACRNWSVNTVKGQREREIALLQDAIDRIKGLPPVTKQEKVHETKREKGQATLKSFFGASPSKDKRKAGTSEASGSSKKAKTKEG